MSGREDVEEFREAFSLFDKIGDGKVDCSEIGDILRALGLNPTEADVGKVLAEIDPSGEKRISFEEFAPLYQNHKRKSVLLTCDQFGDIFRIFDRDNNGMVSIAEVRHILTNLGEKLNSKDVDQLVAGLEDNKGMINYEDFVRGIIDLWGESSIICEGASINESWWLFVYLIGINFRED